MCVSFNIYFNSSDDLLIYFIEFKLTMIRNVGTNWNELKWKITQTKQK